MAVGILEEFTPEMRPISSIPSSKPGEGHASGWTEKTENKGINFSET
jgi:hypothetical protein